MEFREALKDIVISNRISLTSDNLDKTVLVAFSSYCTDNVEMLQFQELKNILVVNDNFGSALINAYLSCKNDNDISFTLLADKIEEISEELEKNNISCFSYSYYISCYLDLIKEFFKDEVFNALELEAIAWINPEKYDYSYQSMITTEKTFGFGRYRASIKDFKIENGVLKKYNGYDPYVVIPSFVSSVGKAAFANNKKIKSVFVPSSVTKIGAEAFSGCEKLETVVLSDNIKHLLADTFKECKLLKRINLNNITAIGKRCFMGCVKLEKINAFALTKVDDEAFSYCISLKNTDFISNLLQIGGRAFERCSMNYITLEKCVYLGTQAFFNCKEATRIALNSNIEIMGVAPFEGCIKVNLLNICENGYNGYVHDLFSNSLADFNLNIKALRCIKKDWLKNDEFNGYNCIQEVEIRKADVIPDNAFANCKNLINVKFDTKVLAIGQSAFAECENLTEIDISYIGDRISTKAFYRCKKLNAENLLTNVDYVGDFAFAYTNLENFDFSKSFKYIGAFAFANAQFPSVLELDLRNCKALPGAFHGVNEISTIYLDSLYSLYHNKIHLLFDPKESQFAEKRKINRVIIDGPIVKRAFKNYSNIRSVEFKVEDSTVPYEAFENCSSLKAVKINGKVASIENDAFCHCSELSTLAMQYDSISVGNYSFYGCDKIPSLIDFSKITYFGDYSFANTEVNKLNLSKNVKYIGKAAFSGCENIEEVTLPFVGCCFEAVKLEERSFGAIFGTVKSDNCIVQRIENGANKLDYYIPKSIKRVTVLAEALSEGCFNGCDFLTEISLPNVVNFDKEYFRECLRLKSVSLGASLKKFSAKSLAGCPSTVKFDINGKCQAYVSLNGTVMTKDKKKLCYLASGDKLSNHVSNISSIGEYAVLNAGRTVEIPDTVKEIEAYAINCENVKSITVNSVENVMKSAFYNCDSLDKINIENMSVSHLFDTNGQGLTINKLELSGVTLKSISSIFSNVADIVIDTLNLNNVSISDIDFFDKVSSVRTIDIFSDIKRVFTKNANISVAYKSMCKHYYSVADLLKENLGVFSLNVKSAKIRPDEFNGVAVEKLALENIPIIYGSAFANSTVKKLTVKNVEYVEDGAFTNSNIDEVVFTDKNYKLKDGILYRDSDLLYCFDKTRQNIVILEFVKRVGKGAIDSLNELKQLSVLSANVFFENKAVNNCVNLSNIELGEIKNKTLRELFDSVSGISCIKYKGKTLKRKFLSKMDSVRQIQLIGVSEICDLAFYGNTALETVAGLENVNLIGDLAFAKCSAIKSIILSPLCKRLGLSAFMECTSLHNVRYPIDDFQCKFNISAFDIFGEKLNPNLKVEIVGGDIPAGYFENFDADIAVTASPENIGDNAFKNSGLTRISLDNTVFIGNSAFSSSKLQNAIIPRATHIGEFAFGKCASLKFLELPFLGKDLDNPDTLEYLFDYVEKLNLMEVKIFAGKIVVGAFKNCRSLVSVFLPKNIDIIPDKCFSGCSKLEKVYNIDSVVKIGERAFFDCSSLNYIEFPSVQVIEDAAFVACKNMLECALSGSIRKIGKNIFNECKSISVLKLSFTKEISTLAALGNGISQTLKEAHIYGGILGEHAFENCGKLEVVEISEATKIIPAYAFSNCDNLRKFTGSDSVTDIGKYAFYNCSALTYVGLFLTLKTIGAQAFANSGLAGKYDLSNVCEIGESAFGQTNIQSVKFGDKLKAIKAFTFEKCEKLESVDMASGVKTIENHAFVCCRALSNISLNSVASIGEKSFYQCDSLKQVSAESLEKMGVSAFENCIFLENVVLGDNLTIIPERAFSGCVKLSNINIPKCLTEIGNRAFASTVMKKAKLKMPSSLLAVGEYIFEDAISPTVYASSNQMSKWNTNWGLNCKGHGLFNLSKKVTVKKI